MFIGMLLHDLFIGMLLHDMFVGMLLHDMFVGMLLHGMLSNKQERLHGPWCWERGWCCCPGRQGTRSRLRPCQY